MRCLPRDQRTIASCWSHVHKVSRLASACMQAGGAGASGSHVTQGHGLTAMHACRLVAQTQAAFVSHSFQHRGFTLTPAYNLAKGAAAVSLTKKLASGHALKGSYSLRDRAAALEVGKAPITVRALALKLSLNVSSHLQGGSSAISECAAWM